MQDIARTNIEAEAWTDHRFKRLARLLGLKKAEYALIECAKVWAWQTAHYTPETPTYVVDPELVNTLFDDDRAADHLVTAELAELVPEGLRMRGGINNEGKSRISWKWETKQKGRRGSEVAKQRREATVGEPTNESRSSVAKRTKESPRGAQRGTQQGALLSSLFLDLDPGSDPERENTTGRAETSAPVSSPSASPISSGWKPDPDDENTFALLEAKTAGVDTDRELKKFPDWARKKGVTSSDWNATWRLFLARAVDLAAKRPAKTVGADAEASRTRAHNAKAAADRERELARQEHEQREQLASADRAAVLELHERLKKHHYEPAPVIGAEPPKARSA